MARTCRDARILETKRLQFRARLPRRRPGRGLRTDPAARQQTTTQRRDEARRGDNVVIAMSQRASERQRESRLDAVV